jgi:serine phosphatase RsbU (regulator of sigma subunit)
VAVQLQEIDPRHTVDAQTLADTILAEALRLDSNRPRDDATVVIVRIAPHEREQEIRRMTVRFPI